MKSFRKETPFERRLRELQEQSESLQSEIGTLSRTLRKYEATPVAEVARPDTAPATTRLNPNYAATVGTGTATSLAVTNQVPVASPDEAEANLFTMTPAAPGDVPVASTHSNSAVPAPRYRRVVKPSPRPLSDYLSSGSFNTGNVPLGHEVKVQRFKAIFLTICAVTFAYILYCAVFR